MILKINCDRPNRNKEDVSKHHWFIMDNITRIRHHNEMVNGSELEKYKDIDRIITDKKQAQSNPRNFIVIYCHIAIPHKEFNEEYSLMFDTIGYLCNDLGQTLEKLVP